MPELVELLSEAVACGASDLHLTAFAPPLFRVDGSLRAAREEALDAIACRDLVYEALGEAQRARLEEEWELDFALQVDGVGRFRGNAHFSHFGVEGAFRYIPTEIPALETLGHEPSIFDLCERRRGLILMTGITGSGKTTTLAAMVRHISARLPGVILTVEDPIEFLFSHDRAIVKQREVGTDTHSFAEGLRRAMRQDPDVILVGELRDPETIAAAVTAAETGHLVLGTLHTIDAPKAMDRIVDAFPAAQQPQIIAQLSNALEAVISQRLIPHESGAGRALATEILVGNTAVRASLRERRWEQLVGLIEIGAKDGMHTIDESISRLYLARQISKEEAIANARDKAAIESLQREPSQPTARKGLFR
jgi:twitching motility protein PilT